MLVAGLDRLIVGQAAVSIPVIARMRFLEGATTFGLIMSVFGAAGSPSLQQPQLVIDAIQEEVDVAKTNTLNKTLFLHRYLLLLIRPSLFHGML
jgi:hypothetical protein